MKKYKVYLQEVSIHSQWIEVDAENETHAMRMTEDMLEAGKVELSAFKPVTARIEVVFAEPVKPEVETPF